VKDPGLYLLHIRDCLARIEQYTADGRETFLATDVAQDAVLRNLQTIGQSVARLPDELKASHPEIDWRGIVGLRNVLVHDYLGVNIVRVWETVERDIPALRRTVDAMLHEMGTTSPE